MTYDYDALYQQQKDALGAPFREFVAFFEDLPDTSANVLDIGCGQGRDALFIARRGHQVTAVDLSPAGIADINKVALSEDLPITGVVADIADYTPNAPHDILLIDRTLHMLDEAPRLAVLAALIQKVTPGGWTLIADEKSNLPGFRQVFADDAAEWTTHKDTKGFLFMQRG